MLKFADCNMAVGQPNAISGLAHLRQRADRVPGAALRHPERACLLQCGAGSASSRRECRDVSDLPTGAFLSACVDGDAQSYWRILERGRAGAPHEVGGCTCGTPSAEIQCAWLFFARLVQRRTVGYAGAYRTLALMDADQSDWETVHAVCCEHPGLKLVITNLYYRHARYIFPLLRQHRGCIWRRRGLNRFAFCRRSVKR